MARRSTSALTEEFKEQEIKLRGTTYRFREISGAAYEEIIKTAEGPDGNADLAAVLKMMLPESLVSPSLTAEQIYAKPLPVLTALQNLVNRMHFRDEPTEAAEDEQDEDEAKNGSEPETS